MSLRFFGFGFGPIQTGLFLYEAQKSGLYEEFTIAEVKSDLVARLRAAGGRFSLNIAEQSRIEPVQIGPLTVVNPHDPDDHTQIVERLARANVITTAVPGVSVYEAGGAHSIAALLAEAGDGEEAVVYCAENHKAAASTLRSAVARAAARKGWQPERYRFVDTVIGKMSAVVDPGKYALSTLAPMVPDGRSALLVEAFNEIRVSSESSHLGARAFPAFSVHEDLAPFEEAKLYGHNAVHYLAGHLARKLGFSTAAQLRTAPAARELLRAAFTEESGPALIARHAGTDALFTPAGFASYGEDLIDRMTNPYLADPVERIIRDPKRKLAWNDRIIGAIRACLEAGIEPVRLRLGAALALLHLAETEDRFSGDPEVERRIREIWSRSGEGDQLTPDRTAGEEAARDETAREHVIDQIQLGVNAAGDLERQGWSASAISTLVRP